MSFTAKVFRVLLASPGDVASEREMIRDVIHEWNAVHSADKGAVLLPVGWESHMAPEMGARPQALINERIARDCDLLIGVFWTRLGTPTGVAPSGTVEEIEEHLEAKKPAMLYFSQAAVRPDSVETDQYAALKSFKDACRKRGVYEEYESYAEFREKLVRQLAITMIRIGGDAKPAQSPTPPPLEPVNLARQAHQIPRMRPMSQPAIDLLIAASRAHDGTLLRVYAVGGPLFQTGGKRLNVDSGARETAKWESAVSELVKLHFMKQADAKGEVFVVTAAGFDEADHLSARGDV